MFTVRVANFDVQTCTGEGVQFVHSFIISL